MVSVHAAPDNLGYAAGVNSCLAATPDADGWWILNPDTLPAPGALSALVRLMQRGDVDALASLLLVDDGSIQSAGGIWRPWLARAVSIGKGRRSLDRIEWEQAQQKMNFINGAAMLITRRFLDSVGPMREDYFLYAEEVEWFVRACRKGMRLGIAMDSRVVHHQGASTGSGRSLSERPRLPIYLDERNKLLVVRDTTPWFFPVAVLTAFPLLVMRYGRTGPSPQLRHALQGWAAGIRNERGKPDWVR
jgi:GT2 family glycosyltransferase